LLDVLPLYSNREWFRSAIPLLFSGLLFIFNSQLSLILLGVLRGGYDAGVYAAANQGASIISFILIASNVSLAPVVAEINTNNDNAQLQKLITKSTRLISVVAFPVAFILILFRHQFMNIFGVEFVVGGSALTLLILGQIYNVAAGPVSMILVMTGYEKDIPKNILIVISLNLVLGLLLIPPFGVTGAAISAASSMVLWNTLLALVVRKRTGLHSHVLGKLS